MYSVFILSQPSWAAWIEIAAAVSKVLKPCGRSPHGLRGLKSAPLILMVAKALSQPSWAAWIEISVIIIRRKLQRVAALMGCVD